MSKTVQIRGVPDDIHRALRTRAAASGRSLSDYLLEEVVRLAERPPISDVLARSGIRGNGVATSAIVDAVRSGRDR